MDFILKEKAIFPKKNDNQKLIQWHIEISDSILDSYIELQRSTLFSDCLYSAVNTVLFKKITSLPPDEIDNLSSYTVISDALDLFTKQELKTLIESSNFRKYKPDLFKNFVTKLDSYKISVFDWIRYVQIQYPKFEYYFLKPWITIGFRPSKDTLGLITTWCSTYGDYTKEIHTKWSLINAKNF